MDFSQQTEIMRYVIGAALALLPAVLWAYVFWKKDPRSRKLTIVTFLAGALSVPPVMLYRDVFSNDATLLGGLLPQFDLFTAVSGLAAGPSFGLLLAMLVGVVVTALYFLLVTAALAFVIDIVDGDDSVLSFREKVMALFGPELYTFAIIGLLVACLAIVLQMSVTEAVFTYLVVGSLEEYAKHLWMRFVNDGTFSSIDDVIVASVLVGIGFAFFENIVYFVDKIWLAKCLEADISAGKCLLHPISGEYIYDVGVLMWPFIGRSLLSILAHACFSGIFGLFYGYAVFATSAYAQQERAGRGFFTRVLHDVLHVSPQRAYAQEKLAQGLLAAVVLHMIFNFLLERGAVLQAGLFIVLCASYLLYLLGQKCEHDTADYFADEAQSTTTNTDTAPQ